MTTKANRMNVPASATTDKSTAPAMMTGVASLAPPRSHRTHNTSSTRKCAGSRRKSHEEVVALLRQNRSKLDSLASALLEHETLDEEDAYAAAGVERIATPSADSYTAAARSRPNR
jgi:ATP-dependent Zn protease